MIQYSIDSTLTLRETPVFRSGLRGCAKYDRKNKASEGYSLSNQSKRKIKQYISGYFLENKAIGKNVSWVTLTIPPRIDGFVYQEWLDDSQIIKQLSKYLENLRANHGLKNYIWVAERQDGKRNNYEHCTGAIHFHCVFDFEGFVDYRNLNLYWLKLLNEKGYKSFSQRSFFDKINQKYFSIENTYLRHQKTLFADIAHGCIHLSGFRKKIHQVAKSEYYKCKDVLRYQDFRSAFNGIDPMTFNPEHPICKIAYNPVDIDKMNMNDFIKLQTYLTKYVSKNESSIRGRVWGASRGFSSVNYEMNISPAVAAELKQIESIVLHESEKKFDIGNNQYTAKTTKFDYSKFIQTEVYRDLMNHIFEQRLNPSPEIPDHIPVSEQYKFVAEAFKEIRSRTVFANDETRVEQIVFPPSSMPVNYEFYDQSEVVVLPSVDMRKRKRFRKLRLVPNMDIELFDFVDKNKKTFK